MKIEPENRELWNMFQSCQRNEMIITKSGRCLFPVLKFKIALEDEDFLEPGPDSTFSYGLSIERVDSYKWKYRHQRWYSVPSVPINSSNLHESSLHIYEPEPSYVTWSNIIHEGLNFSKVKLTNRKGTLSFNSHPSSIKSSESVDSGSSNYFSLCSFGNYVPIVYILDWNCFFRHHQEMFSYSSIVGILKNFDQDQLEREGSLRRIKVNECAFIAVTHYQNDLITHLKKHNNPHAKGFILTDDGMSRLTSPIARGKPGRKRRSLVSANPEIDNQASLDNLSEDVYIASLALEKMSNANVPRSEIATTHQKNTNFIEYDNDFGQKGSKNLLKYKNKLI